MKRIIVQYHHFNGYQITHEEFFVLEETDDHMVISENPCAHGDNITLTKDHEGNFSKTIVYGFSSASYYYKKEQL